MTFILAQRVCQEEGCQRCREPKHNGSDCGYEERKLNGVSDQSGIPGSHPRLRLERRAGNPAADPVDERDHLLQLIQRTLGTGIPLGDDVRRRVESWFGRDLGDVRLHDSEQAAALARRLGAEAFAIKSHVFGPAESLNAKTSRGRGLLAHEITHVIQQTSPDEIGEQSNVEAASQLNETSLRHSGGPQSVWEPVPRLHGEGTHRSRADRRSRLQGRQTTVEQISLQVSDSIVQRATEREAQFNERLASSASEDQGQANSESRKRAPAVDAWQIAAKVHRLMVQDLILERERGAPCLERR